MKLTDAQKTAVTLTGRNILVSAGAGTGKTRVLVERFLYFVTRKENPALVTEILALTYTEKAANEMKRRILDRLAELGRERDRRDLESANISTIHAFCAKILREHPFEAGVDPDFRVIESEESDFLKEQALDEAIEKRCEKGNPVFELLRVYNEDDIRKGILKVFAAAANDGKTLKEFFALTMKPEESREILRFSQDDKEQKETLLEFERFQKNKQWTWETIEDYKEWMAGFSRKKGKKGETGWTDIKKAAAGLLAEKIEILAGPWKEKFESLAIGFEETYETLKKERSFLDFDDLQRIAVRLFEKKDSVSSHLLQQYRRQFRQIMVDEFQDTNPLQLRLIELLAGEDNLFFVGDFKQSIYSFRGAEPSLFLGKEKEYRDNGSGQHIELLENFRTAEPVLAFINRFFETLWTEDGASFQGLAAFAEKAKQPGIERMEILQQEDEPIDLARMREAEKIAARIAELHEQGVEYGEIAVLFQVMTNIGIYEQALKRRGIPYYSVAGTGFYHQPEIRDIASFLSFLENPLADIPLAAALRSPLFQVSDNTLFWLARARSQSSPNAPLYDGVKQFEKIQEIPEEEKEKVRFFLQISGELLAHKDRLKLPELLDRILEKTSYELTVLSSRQGVRSYANLKKMINLAREFEDVEPLSLGAFLRVLKRLETHEVRESEAQVEAEESGRVVRLLTIHRAKGLEYKTVFVADLARRQPNDDAGWIKVEPGTGYAIQILNEKADEWEDPASWLFLKEKWGIRRRAEWKRQFYVAMTRAKERLILSGVYAPGKKEKKTFSEMSCWMDWVMAMPPEIFENVTIHPEGEAGFVAGKKAIAEKILDVAQEKIPAEIEVKGAAILSGLEKKKRLPARIIDLPVSAYAAFEKNPEKYRDVYEIGYPDDGEPERNDPVEPEDSYADFGTAVHKILELLDFSDPSRNLASSIQTACAGMAPEKHEEAAEIVKQFCSTPVFERLQRAQKVYRELPFVINQRHGRVEGVIDVLFQDGSGHWHVLDYKTAVGDAASSKAAGYDLQIGIYALAVQKILKVSPKTGIVYFLKNQAAHVLEFDAARLGGVGSHLAGLQESILNLAKL